MSEGLRPAQLLMQATASEGSAEPMPRALVVVAHPDDEVIALGGRLGRYRNAVFLHATNGAPRDGKDAAAHGFSSLGAYSRARHAELEAALALAGVAAERARELGIADQDAALHFPELTGAVLSAIEELAPEVVVTHPYEGGHPDHDACAFAVHAAARAAERDGKDAPLVVEGAFYHQGPAGIETGLFLQHRTQDPGVESWLSAEEQARKEALFACFSTQREVLSYFRRDVERFRLAPQYDFSQPPHGGTLFYERYPWGMSGARFCELAAEAEAHLGLRSTLCR